MKKYSTSLFGLVLVIALLCGVACDSSDNGGGGTTPAATVTGFNEAGRWEVQYVFGPAVNFPGIIELDGAGNVTAYTNSLYCTGGLATVLLKGHYTKDAAGNIQISVRYTCQGWPTINNFTDVMSLRQTEPNRLVGKLTNFFRHIMAIPKQDCILIRR